VATGAAETVVTAGVGAAAASYAGAVVHANVSGTAGGALLAFSAQLPWVAPAAYLIGAIIKAAHDAKVLKADAQSFSRVVSTVEGVLNEAADKGTLSCAEDAVGQTRTVLEEALAHLHKRVRRAATRDSCLDRRSVWLLVRAVSLLLLRRRFTPRLRGSPYLLTCFPP
jgi:hypothetical protein